MRRLVLVTTVLLLSACVNYSLVEAKRLNLAPGFSVQPTLAWNQVRADLVKGSAVVWTTEGQSLDSLLIFPGVAHGKALFEDDWEASAEADAKKEKPPTFRSDMSPNEIMELFEASMARATRSTLASASALRPAPFAGVPGFRFDFTLTTPDQLERRGIAAGAVREGKLYLIFFQGSRIYHFGKLKDEAERIIESARFG
ncbi:MAG: hypothetical protein EXQ96_00155 [Alphaproteobacteria bacterium]|nr:hypothetical protein [Alphaproteobacteria bacterium]